MKTTPSIADEGLEVYLNRTLPEHNDNGYAEFVEMLASDLKYSKRQIAAAFNVSRDTIYKWVGVYEGERSNVGKN